MWGRTVFFTAPVFGEAEPFADLVGDMAAGKVRALVMLDTNPAYSSPGDLNFAATLAKVPYKVHVGPHVDETALYADWHLPLAHPLESWGGRPILGRDDQLSPADDPAALQRPLLVRNPLDPHRCRTAWRHRDPARPLAAEPRRRSLRCLLAADTARRLRRRLDLCARDRRTRAATIQCRAARRSDEGARRAVPAGPDGLGRHDGEQWLVCRNCRNP